MSSLSARLLLVVSILLVVFFGLAILGLETAFRKSAERSVRDGLDVRLTMLMSAAEANQFGQLSVPDILPEARFSTPGSGLLGQVTLGPGELIWRSPSAVGVFLPISPVEIAGDARFELVEASDGERMFALSRGVSWQDAANSQAVFTFSAAESMAPFYAQVGAFRRQLFSSFALLAALLLAGQAMLLRWVLKPLRQVEDEIGQIEAGERTELSAGYPSELAGLTRNTNRLIRAERKRLARYRNTLGNLAHSLKTPLAVLRNAFASRDGDDALVQQQIDRMNDIVSYQLQRAAAAGGTTLGHEALDVGAITQLIIDSLDKVYADKRVDCQLNSSTAVRYQGDKGDVMEILGNVLDNAYKWCASRVVIDLSPGQTNSGFVFVCEDDGDGIAPSQRDAVLQRGARVDQSVAGQGIGLAVVRELVDIAEGELTMGESQLGGARVRIAI